MFFVHPPSQSDMRISPTEDALFCFFYSVVVFFFLFARTPSLIPLNRFFFLHLPWFGQKRGVLSALWGTSEIIRLSAVPSLLRQRTPCTRHGDPAFLLLMMFPPLLNCSNERLPQGIAGSDRGGKEKKSAHLRKEKCFLTLMVKSVFFLLFLLVL